MNFEQFAGAKPTSSRHPYLTGGGTYEVVVKSIQEMKRTSPTVSEKIVVEMVVESAKADDATAVINAPETTAVAIFDSMTDMGRGNFMAFLNALAGENLVGKVAGIKKAVEIAPGSRIKVNARKTLTKKGTDFTVLNWENLPNDAESLKANRKKYNLG